MAGIHIELDGQSAISHALNQLMAQINDLEPAFADIGEYLLLSHRQRFDEQQSPDGEPWEPLSATSQALKPKNKQQILRLNDILRDHFSYQATNKELLFGSNQVYAAIHQFGGTTSPNSMIPNKTIPARPFLGLSNDDETEVLAILSDHLQNALSCV